MAGAIAIVVVLVTEREFDVGIDACMHIGGQSWHVADAAVMRQVQIVRLAGHDAVHGLVHEGPGALHGLRRGVAPGLAVQLPRHGGEHVHLQP